MPAGSGGSIWYGPIDNPPNGDLLAHARLNQKTILYDTIPSTVYGGMLWMDPATGIVRQMSPDVVHWEILSKGTVDNSFRGFAPNTSSPANPNMASTISFTNTGPDRTFSIAPTGADFRLYVSGVEYIFTTAQTVQITATEGLWYIYFNSSGVLTASQSVWDFESVCPVAFVYWDNTNHLCIYFADERHQVIMDWRTHQYLHTTVGCRYASGLVISGYTLNSSGDSNVEIGLNNGILFDEDLILTPTNGVSGTPASTPNFYYQPLSKPATIPVYYQLGANNVWRKQTTANFYVYPDTPNTTLYYNQYTGGAWQLTDVPSTNYVSYWIFATNDIDNPIIAIMGQQQNSTLANAVTNDTFSALSIAPSVNGIPFLEMKILFQIILRCQNSYAGTTFSRVIQVNDYREVSNMQSSTIGPSANYITSVDTGYFTVTAGELLFTGTHAQAVGSTDSPSFAGLTVGTLVFPTSGNLVTGLVTETAVGITLTATNPTGAGTAYYTPSISGNLNIGSYGVLFAAIADSSNAGKLFLSSSTANVLKYYDTQGSPALHSLDALDLAQSFSGIKTFTVKPVINVSGSGSVLDLYNPANTFYYTLTTAAIGANRILNLPLITATDTLACLGLAQSFSGAITFTAEPIINVSGSGAVLELYNPANTFYYTLTTAAIAANRILNLPLTTATDTLACLGLAQSFSGVITFTAEPIINISGSGVVLRLYNPANTFYYTLTTGAIAATHALNLPVITADDTVAVLGLAETFSASITFSGGEVLNGTVSGTHGQNIGTGDSPTFAGLTITGANYFAITSGGYMEWGGGASYDVELSRTGIGVLTVNGSLTVSSTLTVTGNLATAGTINSGGTVNSISFAAGYHQLWAYDATDVSLQCNIHNGGYTQVNTGIASLTLNLRSDTGFIYYVMAAGGAPTWTTMFRVNLTGNGAFAGYVGVGHAYSSGAALNVYTAASTDLFLFMNPPDDSNPSTVVMALVNAANNAYKFYVTKAGNMWCAGKLTQAGCLPKDISLEEVTQYIVDCQDKTERVTQEELDAVERLVLKLIEKVGID
jgi:hypothetical protein